MSQLSLLPIIRTQRRSSRAWCEPFAGSLAVALFLLGATPPIGYAGNKRRPAPKLAALLWQSQEGPGRVVVADVGPWRIVWDVLARGQLARVIDAIRSWPALSDRDLWHHLVGGPLPSDPIEMAALYLFIQARQAHHAPIWLREEDWRVGGGNGGSSRPGQSHTTWERAGGSGGISEVTQRSLKRRRWVKDNGQHGPAHKSLSPEKRLVMSSWNGCGETAPGQRPPPRNKQVVTAPDGSRPVHRPAPAISKSGKTWGEALSRATLLARLQQLLQIPWDRFEVYGSAREAIGAVQRRDVVYMDPPYLHASVRYAGGPPRDLEELALEAEARGATVGISEGRPLEHLVAAGWTARDITPWFTASQTRKGREYLTYRMAP